MAKTLRHNRAHDYVHLVRRWRKIARSGQLRIKRYAQAGGFDLFYLESSRPAEGRPSVYLSAGIHGDEPGATEGLLAWAEKNPVRLRHCNILLFPCLNPWGLVGNSRLDAEGRDLNRGFNSKLIPQISAQLSLLKGRRFDLALTLHEDYDAEGVYIYEVPREPGYWAEGMLDASAQYLPTDRRKKIEGRSARGGVVRRSLTPDLMPHWPEAFILHFEYARRTFTVETPSEFSLDDRVRAQRAIIARAVALCGKEFSLRTDG